MERNKPKLIVCQEGKYYQAQRRWRTSPLINGSRRHFLEKDETSQELTDLVPYGASKLIKLVTVPSREVDDWLDNQMLWYEARDRGLGALIGRGKNLCAVIGGTHYSLDWPEVSYSVDKYALRLTNPMDFLSKHLELMRPAKSLFAEAERIAENIDGNFVSAYFQAYVKRVKKIEEPKDEEPEPKSIWQQIADLFDSYLKF